MVATTVAGTLKAFIVELIDPRLEAASLALSTVRLIFLINIIVKAATAIDISKNIPKNTDKIITKT
jgi:hypothetical protein